MTSDEVPNIENLRRGLARSREFTHVTQEMLTDPAGLKIQQDLAQKAIRQGRPDVARRALASVKNIQDREEDLRQAQKVLDGASRIARLVIEENK